MALGKAYRTARSKPEEASISNCGGIFPGIWSLKARISELKSEVILMKRARMN